ncbi:NAD(P)/FAD-dependent oxidoreductase [Nocardioides islandensis]|nr:NAD(P)/FAD-dependent oxidoreductase [Nocardioides islandensis]
MPRILADMNDYDVLVIGGGAAGLSAALVLARAQRRVAVVDAGEPRNAPAQHMQGFLSRDGLPPAELLRLGRAEVSGYGADIVAGRVTDVRRAGDAAPGFEVALADGDVLGARRLLVATGLRDVLPDIPGVRERWGRDLLHCPYCHGHEVRSRPLGVIGGTPEAVAHAHLVRQWSDDVVVFPHTDTLTADDRERLLARAVGVVDGPVGRLVVHDDELSGVEMADGRVVPRAAVFVRPRLVPDNEVLVGLGCALDENGWVVADATGRTSVAGVWVAGNVANPRAQVITAAGEGSAAAIALNADLVDEDVAAALDAFRRTP